jgi:PadR family transcriptional regulator PadR
LHSIIKHFIFVFRKKIRRTYTKIKKMNIDNTASQMRKGVLEFCILSVIKLGEAYPSDIIDKMKAANLNILEGTLYPLLTRLKNAEFLTYRWVESNSGPPRKYFSLTEKGADFYKELESTWLELANAVEAITGNKN